MLKSEAKLAIAGWHKVVRIIVNSEFTVNDQDPARGDVEIQWWNPAKKVFDRIWIGPRRFEELLRSEAEAQRHGKHAQLLAHLPIPA
jgi:hypothetical protein